MATLRERTVFADDRLSVTVTESLELQISRTNRKCFMIGNMLPITVVVREPAKTYAIDIDSNGASRT